MLFDVEVQIADYGSLSKRDLREMIAGARVEVAPYKRSAQDFVIWKPSTPEMPGWDSPWGRGRPGWHIECSAMSEKHLGKTIDIHAGGRTWFFRITKTKWRKAPAHMMARHLPVTGCTTVFWSSTARKMSKSLGNVLLVHDMIKNIPGELIRLALAQCALSSNHSTGQTKPSTLPSACSIGSTALCAVLTVGDADREAAEPPQLLMRLKTT